MAINANCFDKNVTGDMCFFVSLIFDTSFNTGFPINKYAVNTLAFLCTCSPYYVKLLMKIIVKDFCAPFANFELFFEAVHYPKRILIASKNSWLFSILIDLRPRSLHTLAVVPTPAKPSNTISPRFDEISSR